MIELAKAIFAAAKAKSNDLLKRAKAACNDLARWNYLRPLSQSSAIRMTLVMPLVGYMILLNDNLTGDHFFALSKYIAPGAWTQARLYLLYFGFWAISIALLLFQAFCPVDVKRHGTSWELIDRELPTMGDAQREQISRHVTQGLYGQAIQQMGMDVEETYRLLRQTNRVAPVEPSHLGKTILDTHRYVEVLGEKSSGNANALNEIHHKIVWYTQSEQGFRNALWTYWHRGLVVTRPKMRLAILGIYVFGFALLAVPAVELLVRVIASFSVFIVKQFLPDMPS